MKLFPFSSLSNPALLGTGLLLGGLVHSHADVLNGGFESGTSSWVESGGSGNFTAPAQLTGFYQTISPDEGAQLGVISNDGLALETISQTFTLPAEPVTLSLRYLFLTDSYNDPAFNDSARAVLTPGSGAPITLFTVSRNDLQAGGDGPLLPGAQFFDVQTISQSLWQTSTTDLSAYAGQTVTLSFEVDNGGDPDFVLESRLAVDRVSLAAVPEPAAGLLPVLAAGFLVQRRRRHQ